LQISGTFGDELIDDDWVIVNDPLKKFAQYNTKERLARESRDLHNSKANCVLIGRNNDMSEPVALTDFIIKKVIDKGSFGKVFLVQN